MVLNYPILINKRETFDFGCIEMNFLSNFLEHHLGAFKRLL
jgi:hypothetical protein